MAYEHSEYRIAGGLPVNVGMRQCDVAWLSSRMWSGTVVTQFDANPPSWRSLREILGEAIFGNRFGVRQQHDISELRAMDERDLHDLGVIREPVPPAYSDHYAGC